MVPKKIRSQCECPLAKSTVKLAGLKCPLGQLRTTSDGTGAHLSLMMAALRPFKEQLRHSRLMLRRGP